MKKQTGSRAKSSIDNNNTEDEEMASFTKACLVEKWMEKEITAKLLSQSTKTQPPFLQENNLLFFNSTSISSNNSDTEFFNSNTKPNQIRTREINHQQEDSYLFDDYQNYQKNNTTNHNMIKSKSRALRIYTNLKKVKQPISPGGKLTSFFNSLFNINSKSKNVDKNKGSPKISSTCSSASSFSRSCLSKCSPKSNKIQRTVRFNPVSVIVDEDTTHCVNKNKYDHGCKKPPLPPNAMTELKLKKNRGVEESAQNVMKGYNRQRSMRFYNNKDDDDEDDVMSDSSSDLFELDNLDYRFCEELPVYETTTYFNRNL
ncbi:hypothetical protein ACJIZ3_023207 [Penstemon smallii]|uniref:Protein BIG GRAIN 1-like B n=1 Tax=Penstemon smallii TaxID=265156 RepID=A0ABD3TPQ8_9LAMI